MENRTQTFDAEPNWEPLKRAVASVLLLDFMHMGRIGTIELYKHRNTRRYLNIDAVSGRFFEYRDATYVQVDPESAMRFVLEGERRSRE